MAFRLAAVLENQMRQLYQQPPGSENSENLACRCLLVARILFS